MDIAIHINPHQPHQVKHADCLEAGFKKHGLKVLVTSQIVAEADIHVVSGPWYAKNHWQHQKAIKPDTGVILLDRCYYKGDPEYISLGWMNDEGDRHFTAGEGREPVKPGFKGSGCGTIFLADYNGQIDNDCDYIRYHPANFPPKTELAIDLLGFSKAVGYRTTALVDAVLMGLDVECRHPGHILNQPDWEYLLPWADWSHLEIRNGDFWEHLKTCRI